MWKVLKKRDVPNYWTLAEYVSLVVDVVPDMLMHKHRLQLLLGLRARYILELCRNDLMDLLTSNLIMIKPKVDEPGPDIVVNFVELIHSLLKDPEARQEFFTEVFPVEYGTQYDNDLQTLFSEFIYRLNQLLPVPDMEQTVSWLGNDCSPLGDCEHSVCEPADLTNLLRHHKNLGHLEQHGNTSADKEDVRVENSGEGSDISNRAEETAAALPREPAGVGEGEEAAAQSLMDFTLPGSQDYLASPHQASLGPHDCLDCKKKFKFASSLTAHRVIHTGERPHRCSKCGRCFSFRQSLDRHRHTHKTGRNYDCLICGGFFKSLLALKEHSSSHVENGEYLCRECGRAFAWKSALVRHIKTHGKDADMPESSYKCPHCQQVFSSAGYLNKHLLSHKERAHTCSCGKSFSYRAALTAHQRTHQKDRPHVCAQCGKGFLYKGGLLSHMKIHSEEKPFMCSFCGKSFKRERNMKKHERCHTRENVFCCSQCDKSFVYKATLTRHELTHSGERPFLCSDCGKGFFSHAELLKHERFHTGHKPFQCPHCGKKFTQSCYLTIHLRYHTGVRPYSCTECDKRFLSANRLKRHQRIHTGEKPYLCGECGKSFRQSYNLKMHQRTHIVKLT
uniref:C2H2-type domain-containing protein n=1 Tax=Takifugu rubripes TaxID=31033 RepID=A0A674NF22_TAKRU